jgi:hypothetical protein
MTTGLSPGRSTRMRASQNRRGWGQSTASTATTVRRALLRSVLAPRTIAGPSGESGQSVVVVAWAFYMAMSNHLRVNNDTAFLHARAANSSQSVEQALEGILIRGGVVAIIPLSNR